jgi:hypothetical protein
MSYQLYSVYFDIDDWRDNDGFVEQTFDCGVLRPVETEIQPVSRYQDAAQGIHVLRFSYPFMPTHDEALKQLAAQHGIDLEILRDICTSIAVPLLPGESRLPNSDDLRPDEIKEALYSLERLGLVRATGEYRNGRPVYAETPLSRLAQERFPTIEDFWEALDELAGREKQ